MNKQEAKIAALKAVEFMIWIKVSSDELDTEFGEDAVKVRSAMQAILVEMNEKIVKLNKKAKSD